MAGIVQPLLLAKAGEDSPGLRGRHGKLPSLVVDVDCVPRSPTRAEEWTCSCCGRSFTTEPRHRCCKCQQFVCPACSQTKVVEVHNEAPARTCDACVNDSKRAMYAEMKKNSSLRKRASAGRLSFNLLTSSPASCPSPRLGSFQDEADLLRVSKDVQEWLQAANFKCSDFKADQFQELRVLGRGASGSVKLMKHLPSDQLYAAKVISLTMEFEANVVQQELEALQLFSHPNLVAGLTAFMKASDIHVILEYMDRGSLEDLRKCNCRFPNAHLAFIAHEIVEGLSFLHTPAPEIHKAAMLHRDLKPANILLNSRGEVKIADFGIITVLKTSVNAFVGTGQYMSPERIRGDGYSTDSDIWSLGITLSELALGRLPFGEAKCQNFMGLYNCIMNCHRVDLPLEYQPAGAEFVNSCFHKDPHCRPTTAALKEFAWLRERAGQAEFAAWLAEQRGVQSPKSQVRHSAPDLVQLFRSLKGVQSPRGQSFRRSLGGPPTMRPTTLSSSSSALPPPPPRVGKLVKVATKKAYVSRMRGPLKRSNTFTAGDIGAHAGACTAGLHRAATSSNLGAQRRGTDQAAAAPSASPNRRANRPLNLSRSPSGRTPLGAVPRLG